MTEKRKSFVAAFLAVLLAAALLFGLAGCAEPVERNAGAAGVSAVPLTVRTATNGDVTVTADVGPSYASDKTLEWSVQFEDPTSVWAAGKETTAYVSVTVSEDTLSAAVRCLAPFGEPIVLKAASAAKPSVFGTCLLGYKQRVELVSVGSTEISVSPFQAEQAIPYKSKGNVTVTELAVGLSESEAYTVAANVADSTAWVMTLNLNPALAAVLQDAARLYDETLQIADTDYPLGDAQTFTCEGPFGEEDFVIANGLRFNTNFFHYYLLKNSESAFWRSEAYVNDLTAFNAITKALTDWLAENETWHQELRVAVTDEDGNCIAEKSYRFYFTGLNDSGEIVPTPEGGNA